VLFIHLIAVQHGCDASTIEYLIRSHVASLFHRNSAGKTPLYMAVEYVCSTVVSIQLPPTQQAQYWNMDDRREVLQGGHPQQIPHDVNALQVLEILVRMGPKALEMQEYLQGMSPLHRLVCHKGPGRQEALFAILKTLHHQQRQAPNANRVSQQEIGTFTETFSSGTPTSTTPAAAAAAATTSAKNNQNKRRRRPTSQSFPPNQASPVSKCTRSTSSTPSLLQQKRREDHMTPLHLACMADFFAPNLVKALCDFEPNALTFPNGQNCHTPLHMLCSWHPSSAFIKGRLLMPVCQEELTQLLVHLCDICPAALQITEKKDKKLPLHLYLESAIISPKRPEVVLAMLNAYPESASIPSSTLGPMAALLTSQVLVSSLASQLPDLYLDFRPHNGKVCEKPPRNRTPSVSTRIVDPNLLSLNVLLHHGWLMQRQSKGRQTEGNGLQQEEQAKQATEVAIATLRLFLHLTPVNCLQARVCGNAIKCVVRVIVSAAFHANYTEALHVLMDTSTDMASLKNNLFLERLKCELQSFSDLMEISSSIARSGENHQILDSLSRHAEFLLGHDGILVTMSVLLPSLADDIFFIMFPTWTPEWFAGKAVCICPIFLAFGVMKWCKDRDLRHTFNLPLAAAALQLPTSEFLLPNAKRAQKFLTEHKESFDSGLVNGVCAFAQSVLDAGAADEQEENNPSSDGGDLQLTASMA
jgi:hypothetical protein